LKSSNDLNTSDTLASIPARDPDPLLHLQHTIGNQAVMRSLRADGLESGSNIENGQTTARQSFAQELDPVVQQATPSVSASASPMSQRNIDTEAEANWNKLSAPIREEVENCFASKSN
jgi:hypothetical protein